jgi:hypothetical protein
MSRNEITSVPALDEKERDMVDHIEHDNEKNTTWTKNKHMDDAARILHEAGGHRDYSAEDRRRVLRRIDLFVCVPMCITYFIQQVCRVVSRLTPSRLDLTISSTSRPSHTPPSLIFEKQPT